MSGLNPIDRFSIFLGEKISYFFLVSVIITACLLYTSEAADE